MTNLSALTEPDILKSLEDEEIKKALETVVMYFGEDKVTQTVYVDTKEQEQIPPLLNQDKLKKKPKGLKDDNDK